MKNNHPNCSTFSILLLIGFLRKKDWFAGVHIWQMRTNSKRDWKINNLDFTPQGKPAEKIIAKGFE